MTRIRWFCSVHAYCFSEVGSEIAVCPMDFQGKPCVTGGFSTARGLFFQRIRMDQACRSQSLRRQEVGATRDMPWEHDPKLSQVSWDWNHMEPPKSSLEVESLVWLDAFEHLWTSLNIFERLISFNANAISSISTRCRRASTSLHKQLGVEARIEIHRKLSVCLGKACLQNTSSSVEGYNVLEYIYNML